MKENKFNQKKFRELLKKGIGLRTQKEFAAQAGMSPATINRMLNEDVIARPKIKTLEALTNHMHNVTYSELMDACGYETPGIEEVVRGLESDISDFFAFSDGISFFPSMEAMFERLHSFVQRDGVQIVRVKEKENTGDDIPGNIKEKGAEEETIVSINWRYNNCECQTEFHVYYILTKLYPAYCNRQYKIFPESIKIAGKYFWWCITGRGCGNSSCNIRRLWF